MFCDGRIERTGRMLVEIRTLCTRRIRIIVKNTKQGTYLFKGYPVREDRAKLEDRRVEGVGMYRL